MYERGRKDALSEAVKLAGLNLYSVVVIHYVISGFQATVVKILKLVDAWVIIVCERASINPYSGVCARHVIPKCV